LFHLQLQIDRRCQALIEQRTQLQAILAGNVVLGLIERGLFFDFRGGSRGNPANTSSPTAP